MQSGLESKRGRVDRRKISSISKKEIEEQAALEKKALGIDDEGLLARPVFKSPDIRQLRERLGLSQTEFANRYALSHRTIQQWEQKRSQPDQPARLLLRAIEKEPYLMAHIINGLRKEPESAMKPISALLDSGYVEVGQRGAASSLLIHEVRVLTEHDASALVNIEDMFGGKKTLRTTKDPNSNRSLLIEK